MACPVICLPVSVWASAGKQKDETKGQKHSPRLTRLPPCFVRESVAGASFSTEKQARMVVGSCCVQVVSSSILAGRR